jgi:hypothetical protein
MGRITKRPVITIAISPAGLGTAIGVQPKVIYDAILVGEFPLYQRGMARRILVADAEDWIRRTWRKAKPRRTKIKTETINNG